MAEVVLAENRGPGIQETRPRKRAKVDHVRLRVKKLADHAVLPRRATPGAAGYDLSSAQDLVIPAQASGLVKTGLALAIPHGTYGRVAPRSGLALRHSIAVGAGVIDEDYRGELRVILFNHGEKHFEVKRGDRIAQLILERICTPEVEEVSELDTTERGAGGFGSTGVPLSEKSLNDEATQQ